MNSIKIISISSIFTPKKLLFLFIFKKKKKKEFFEFLGKIENVKKDQA